MCVLSTLLCERTVLLCLYKNIELSYVHLILISYLGVVERKNYGSSHLNMKLIFLTNVVYYFYIVALHVYVCILYAIDYPTLEMHLQF